MGRLRGIPLDNKFLERLGFAVSAFEYFMALEESEQSMGFDVFWPSMVAAALHIQRANYDELRETGEAFLNRYLEGLVGYEPGRPAPVILSPPVSSDICSELSRLREESECVKLVVGE